MPNRTKRQRSLATLLENSDRPLLVLDRQLVVVSFNRALSEWLQLEAAEIVGTSLHYDSSPHHAPPQLSLNLICPPPNLLSRETCRFEYVRPLEDSSHSPSSSEQEEWPKRRAMVTPLGQSRGDELWMVLYDSADSAPIEQATSGKDSPESTELHNALINLRRELPIGFQFEQLMGQSSSIEKVRAQIKLASQLRPRMLIVGKAEKDLEHLAKSIHYADAPEQAGPLVPIECSLMDPELLQSTVVGVKKLLQSQQSLQQGWFLLLNVHELNQAAQHELLGLLELPGFDMPTLATSTVPLTGLREAEQFDRDLATRLSTLTIELPSLRERREDIPFLVQAIVEEQNATSESQFQGFTEEAMDRLVLYDWPGEYEELRRTILESLQAGDSPLIGSEALPKRLSYAESATRFAPIPMEAIELDPFLAEIESELIERALAACHGNKTRAAEVLGISRARLHRKLESETDLPNRED